MWIDHRSLPFDCISHDGSPLRPPQHLYKSCLLESRGGSGKAGDGREIVALCIDGIALDDFRAMLPGVSDGGSQQLHHQAVSAIWLCYIEADDRPDRQCIHSFQRARAFQLRERFSWRDRAPADRFTCSISQQPRDFAGVHYSL